MQQPYLLESVWVGERGRVCKSGVPQYGGLVLDGPAGVQEGGLQEGAEKLQEV